MLGFLIGTVCLIALVKVARRGRTWGYGSPWMTHGGGCGGGSSWGAGGGRGRGRRRGGWMGGGLGRNFFLRAAFERLDTSPGQEKAIRAALEELRVVARSVRADVASTRADIARAMRGDLLDEDALSDVSTRVTAAGEAMRAAAVGALAKVHAALDEQQRATLADLIESGPGFGGRGGYGGFPGGPYRTAGVA
jgi:uncharacterized membrane protein